MPVKIKRTSNVCDRCGEDVSVVGQLREFEQQLLCSRCYAEAIKEKNLKCPECEKVVGLDKMTEYKTKPMCYECKANIKNREARSQKIKSFLKRHWFKWIMIALTIIAILTSVYIFQSTT